MRKDLYYSYVRKYEKGMLNCEFSSLTSVIDQITSIISTNDYSNPNQTISFKTLIYRKYGLNP